MVSTLMGLNVLKPPNYGVFSALKQFFWQFSAVTHISKVNCTDMARDRPGQPANRIC